jgi:hypothetical protein
MDRVDVSVRVLEGARLAAADVGLLAVGKSDPYCVLLWKGLEVGWLVV